MRKKISFEGLARLPFEEWMDEPPVSKPVRNIYEKIEIPATKNESKDPQDRLLYYLSLGSGSSGNSCYLGTRKGGILIDAGIKADEIIARLRANGIDMKKIAGIVLTHDHSDHVKHVYSMIKSNRHMRVFCTNRVLNGILRRHSISKNIKDYHTAIFKEIPFNIGDLEITAFEVSHDGTDNMGFSINFDDRKFVLATDLGAVGTRARHYMEQANYLVIESNYDLKMLLHGRYPEYLKARIQTEYGHMDNRHTAAFLKEIITPKLKNIFLCHLSQDNNTPEKALEEVRGALESIGKKVGTAMETLEDRQADVQLMALPRFETSPLFVFRPLVDLK